MLTPIIIDAMKQGLLLEATEQEIKEQQEKDKKEKEVQAGERMPDLGRTREETLKLQEDKSVNKSDN